MPIYFNSFVVILSQDGIIKKWHKPMDADNAIKIYEQYKKEANKEIVGKIVFPNHTSMVGDLSNKFIKRLTKQWRGDIDLCLRWLLNINYISEYGSTKIQLVHSSQT